MITYVQLEGFHQGTRNHIKWMICCWCARELTSFIISDACAGETMSPSISDTVRGFATTLSKGIKASMRGILQENHDAMLALKQSVQKPTSEDDDLPASSPSETYLPGIDDPSNLVLRVLAVEITPSSEKGGASYVRLHYTWNDPTECPELFFKDCIVSDDAESAIEATGYSSWPLESLKNVFNTRLVTGQHRVYDDEHVHAISASKACTDHHETTDGGCRVMVISGQPFDGNPADILA